jgi:RNA polymerase sigma-70 factor (ECF subfamily)
VPVLEISPFRNGRRAWQAEEMAVETAAQFEEHRGRLFGLAYRMLGSAADAEDVVQDAYLRWHGADPAAIESPAPWLAKVVTNLALNRLTSERARRERYAGPWLPEPVLTADGTLGPLDAAEQRESVSLGLLVLMERLTPTERAVFVLREAFGYSHHEIASILDLSEPNCRQLHSRARQRLSDARPRFHPARGEWQELVLRFLAAAADGDVPALEQMLAADATAWADGGGKVRAARRAVRGRSRVARYLAGFTRQVGTNVDVFLAEVNGDPAVVALAGPTLIGVLVMEVSGSEVTAVRAIANPDKLEFAAGQVSKPGPPDRSPLLSHLGTLPGT